MGRLAQEYYELVFVQRGLSISEIALRHHLPRETIVSDLQEYGLYTAGDDSIEEHERTYDHNLIASASTISGVAGNLVEIAPGGVGLADSLTKPTDFEVVGAVTAHELANDHSLLHDSSIIDGDTVDNAVKVLNDVLTWDGAKWIPAAPPGASGGEANTGSNIGSEGVGLYDQKLVVDLQFKNIAPGSARVTVTDVPAKNTVEVDVPAAAFEAAGAIAAHLIAQDHTKLHSNALDHTQGTDQGLDTGGANAVTVADVKDAVTKKHANTLDHTSGNDQFIDHGGANECTAANLKDAVTKKHSNASDHASSLLGTKTLDEAAIGNAKVISYNSGTGNLEFVNSAAGGDVIGPAANTDHRVPKWNGTNSKELEDGYDVGTAANNLLQLDGAGKIPAVDGSQITNLPAGGASFWTVVPGTPTRVSDSQFTIADAGNANLYNKMFVKGTIIKWEKSGGGFQCAIIKAAAYGSNVVTIDILGNDLVAGFTDMKYCIHPAKWDTFIVPGVLPGNTATTDIAKTIYAIQDLLVFAAQIRYKTASATTKGVWDINDDGTSIFTTKPEIAATATLGTEQISNCILDTALTVVAKDSAITLDYDSGHATTPGSDAYVIIWWMPESWRYLA
jgi:hypothetical protein